MTPWYVYYIVNSIDLLVMTVVPIWTIIRFKDIGFFLAALLVWWYPLLRWAAMNRMTPPELFAIVQFYWLIGGWGFALIYTLVIYLLVWLAFALGNRFRGKRNSVLDEPAPSLLPKGVRWAQWRSWLPRFHPVERVCLTLLAVYFLALAFIAFEVYPFNR